MELELFGGRNMWCPVNWAVALGWSLDWRKVDRDASYRCPEQASDSYADWHRSKAFDAVESGSMSLAVEGKTSAKVPLSTSSVCKHYSIVTVIVMVHRHLLPSVQLPSSSLDLPALHANQ